jgi:hypothetical protein
VKGNSRADVPLLHKLAELSDIVRTPCDTRHELSSIQDEKRAGVCARSVTLTEYPRTVCPFWGKRTIRMPFARRSRRAVAFRGGKQNGSSGRSGDEERNAQVPRFYTTWDALNQQEGLFNSEDVTRSVFRLALKKYIGDWNIVVKYLGFYHTHGLLPPSALQR